MTESDASIASAEPYILRVPIGAEIADSFNVADEVELPGMRLTLDDGTVANGYTMTLGAGGSAIFDHLKVFAPMLTNRKPSDVEQLWDELFWSPLHWVGRAGTVAMAQSAVDVALWDAIAKTKAQPLWQVLGGSADKKLPAYDTHAGWLNIPTDQLVANALSAKDAGMIGVKVKLGNPDSREDVERVSKVRQAIGDSMRLMTDVNQKWELGTAIWTGLELDALSVYWLEEPMDPDDVHAHTQLAIAIKTPIALGEHLYTRTSFRDFLQHKGAEILQPDVTRAGGVTGFLGVAGTARQYRAQVCAHAGDLMQVHQHLSFALDNIEMLEYLPWCTQIWKHPAQIKDGFVTAPAEPGASTDFTNEAFETYRVA